MDTMWLHSRVARVHDIVLVHVFGALSVRTCPRITCTPAAAHACRQGPEACTRACMHAREMCTYVCTRMCVWCGMHARTSARMHVFARSFVLSCVRVFCLFRVVLHTWTRSTKESLPRASAHACTCIVMRGMVQAGAHTSAMGWWMHANVYSCMRACTRARVQTDVQVHCPGLCSSICVFVRDVCIHSSMPLLKDLHTCFGTCAGA
jgi:hypothetical protein